MPELSWQRRLLLTNGLILALLILLAIWVRSFSGEAGWRLAGLTNFSLGFLLLAGFLFAQMLKFLRLPLLSGYIIAGIIAGPQAVAFLSEEMVADLRLIDDLALSFIALTAGGALQLQSLHRRRLVIGLNILVQPLVVFGLTAGFILYAGPRFTALGGLSWDQLTVLAILIGVIAVARSPSSAIAVINECRARGPFTDTILGVTVALDVLIIVFFTLALAAAKMILAETGTPVGMEFTVLFLEITLSIILGILLGKGIAWYFERADQDLSLFLLFFAFGVTRISFWLSGFMEARFAVYLDLEPLLICMSTGFYVQNYSPRGKAFMDSLNRFALPIYVLFFSLAGAALDLGVLALSWPLALALAGVRLLGILIASWFTGAVTRDPPMFNRSAWMAYLTQAGVSIGLAQLAARELPAVGVFLSPVVMAAIALNQLVGPVTFKAALGLVKEAQAD